jgi:hypothetical protein
MAEIRTRQCHFRLPIWSQKSFRSHAEVSSLQNSKEEEEEEQKPSNPEGVPWPTCSASGGVSSCTPRAALPVGAGRGFWKGLAVACKLCVQRTAKSLSLYSTRKPDCTSRKTMVGFACQKVSLLLKLPTGDGDIENRLLWACGQELQGYLSSDRCRYFARYAESIILL